MIKDIDILLDKYYGKRDESHGIQHVKSVYEWTKILTKDDESLTETDLKLIEAGSLLHDVYDHKYCDNDKIKLLKDSLKKDLLERSFTNEEINFIYVIIENISFSKEFNKRKQGIKMNLGDLQKLRDIVSDADKIEAVGVSGITRMIQYEETLGGDKDKLLERHFNHIRDHCSNRLYLLISENYIKTDMAKKIVIKRLKQMKNIVDDDNILKIFIKKHIDL